VARKTTTTTTVQSNKDSDGNWQEFHKEVVTVVERDEDGYPYGPLDSIFSGSQYAKNRYGRYGDFLTWYELLGARPASKPQPEQEDGQDG
jgi:hypothetical protein